MFISAVEKLHLKNSIESLSKIVNDMTAELLYLSAKVKAMEGRKTTKKKKLTEEQRKKQREYARRYQAKKKLEKQNGHSVSTTGQ